MIVYATLQQVMEDHDLIIGLFGGKPGIRDIGLLASALEMPKATMFNEELHPTFFDKAAAYLFHIIANHPFVDGNKRTATVTSLSFLRQNNFHIIMDAKKSFEFEELIVSIAAGQAKKDQIANFFKRHHIVD